ncbi:hypothetical protein ACOME3_001904 [Neoechinorhynchus agilis]
MVAGIHGYRKNALYLALFIGGHLILINFIFTAWILLLLKPSISSFGPIEITSNKAIKINGHLNIAGDLKANRIASETSLHLTSPDSIVFEVVKTTSGIKEALKVEPSGVNVFGSRISLNTEKGKPLVSTFMGYVDISNAALLFRSNLNVTSITTGYVSSKKSSLEISSDDILDINAPRNIKVKKSEQVDFMAHETLRMSAKVIKFESENIYLLNLIALFTAKSKYEPHMSQSGVHLCIKMDGTVFAADNCADDPY